MNKILSWKINNASYAYIFPTNGSYISNAISEDSPLWANIIGELSTWTLDTYKSNFNKMAAEVKSKFGVTIPWKDEYWDLGIDGSINGVNIVLLSGKGGDGGYSGDSAINSEVYEEFNKMIDAELQKAREEIEKKNAEVKAFVETKVTETISAAKQTIAETKAEIDETRDELEGKLAGATEALDKAAALFELGEGGIDGEAIKDVMNSVSAHTTWLNTYSGSVADFQTDYDIATKRLGEMTVASSVTDGLFSRFATSMNVVSGTVGSVERTMNAAYGEIRDAAEWIDTNKDSVANVSRFMSASAALIEDKVKYIDNELTSVIERTVDGKNATIRDEIKAETASGLTNVRNEMNALSGSILQELTHYAPDSAITSIGNRMDVLNTTMSEWMTKTDSAMSMTHDLREEWSIESGKISTVTNLVAKTDANGEIEYWISGTTGEEIRVSRTENGSWVDNRGNFYNDNRVYVHYSDTLGSYIQQEVSAISMSVMGKDNVTAAIQLAVKEDADNGGEAIINMVANKVVIDATVIANAISAKTANIGGIVIGNGIIYATACDSYGRQAFYLNGQTGKITAFDAEIHGDIVAKSLKLENQNIDEYIAKKTISQDDINNTIQNFVKSSEFTDIVKNQGVISQEYFNKWAAENNLTEEQVKKISSEIVGAEINQAGKVTRNEDGSFTHTVKIGEDEYTWKTRDLGDYLLLGNQVSGNTSNGKASFIISRDGLLEAENAVIYGKVYASEGYFNGAVTATTLTIGQKPVSDVINESIDEKTKDFATQNDINAVEGKIPSTENINKIIDDFTKTTAFTEIIKNGVVTKEEMEAAFKASGFTDEKAEEIAKKIDVPTVSHSGNDDGSITHTLTNSNGTSTSWTTYDADDYVVLGKGAGTSGSSTANTYTIIDKNGLLTADNAIIHGTIYAQAGEIGGMSLHNNMLEVKDSSSNDTIAFLNGTNSYSSTTKGKLILASGIDNDIIYYNYFCEDTKGKKIELLTQELVSFNNGYLNGDLVKTYSYDEYNNDYFSNNEDYRFFYDFVGEEIWGENTIFSYDSENEYMYYVDEYFGIEREYEIPQIITGTSISYFGYNKQLNVLGGWSSGLGYYSANTSNYYFRKDNVYYYKIAKSTNSSAPRECYYIASSGNVFSSNTCKLCHQNTKNPQTIKWTTLEKFYPHYNTAEISSGSTGTVIQLICDKSNFLELGDNEYYHIKNAFKINKDNSDFIRFKTGCC